MNQKGKCVPQPDLTPKSACQSATATGLTPGDAWKRRNRPHASPDSLQSLQTATNKSLNPAQNNSQAHDAKRSHFREAHGAEESLPMRLPIPTHGRNSKQQKLLLCIKIIHRPTASCATRAQSLFLRTFLSLAVSKSATVLISCWLRL